MKYEYDVAVVGLGPAGMAVAIMGASMDLKVAAIEAHKLGGECMNVGCIPSKALLRAAAARHTPLLFERFGMKAQKPPKTVDIFGKIQAHLEYISEKKTRSMFDKTDLILGQGRAQFVDPHRLRVGDRELTAKRIYLCVGTRPALPPITGMDSVDALTNESLFNLKAVPGSLLVVGSGAIACEMAQGFARLGSDVTMVMRGPGLLWREDPEACALLRKTFEDEGIRVLTDRTIQEVQRTHTDTDTGTVVLRTAEDGAIEAEQILAATGRRMDFDSLQLDNAGVAVTRDGITVNRRLQTSRRHIYACGDCNGHALFSHAAMHQGMLALMHSMMPRPFGFDFRTFPVPWTVFTEPAFSRVGSNEQQLRERGVRFEAVTVRYEDYGAAIAENLGPGFIKVLVSPTGRIHGATLIGHVSGELVNEWTMAIQNGVRMHSILLQQHSFPTMGFLNKRVAETWMTQRMASQRLRGIACGLFRRLP